MRRLQLPELLLLLVLVQTRTCSSIAVDQQDGPVKLLVLVLIPFPNPSNSTEGWDRGLELLPAARLAARQINNRTDILDGYEIQLIEANSDPCGVSLPTNSVNNFAQHALDPNPLVRNAMAVVGLACSTVTASISLLSGRPEVDLLQVSMANSPVFVHNAEYKRLWRVLPSSLGFVESALSLMDKLDWQRVGVVYDGVGVYFQATAEEFIERALQSDKTLVINFAIDNTDLFLDTAIERIQAEAVRIIYVSASIPETSRLLCKAAQNNLVWPGYQWIFNERTVDELIYNNNNECSTQEMKRASENVISIFFNLQNPQDYLVSGQTYDEYRAMYVETLNEMVETDPRYVNAGITYDNPYANAMYDELWALSLALNMSLPDLQAANISLADYQYNRSYITDIIEDNFEFVSFSGAVSKISFDEHRESLTPSILCRVTDGRMFTIGGYNITNHQLSLLDNISVDDFPEDDFVVVEEYLHVGMSIILYTLSGLGAIVTTAKLLAYYYHSKTPDIKATSPLLMSLIFVGSYFMLTCSFLIVLQPVAAGSEGFFSAICITWRTSFFIGFGMLVSTVLFRVMRIYRVFTHFGKTGKAWKNKYLFLYILLVSAIPLIQTILMVAVDRNQYGVHVETNIYHNPPIKVRTLFCDATYLIAWQFFSGLYIFILLILLISFALLTRKIDRKHFKDTKKIIIFAFIMSFTILLGYPIIDILRSQLANKSISTFLLGLLCLVVTLIAQVFLVDTKVFPALYHYTIKKETKASSPPSTPVGLKSYPTTLSFFRSSIRKKPQKDDSY